MSETFFIGDTHFGHKAILSYQGSAAGGMRNFSSIEQHDSMLIQMWNGRVGKSDIVYHLGDFSMGSRSHWWEVRGQLNGKITLIRGNHDDGLNGDQLATFERVERLLEVRIPGLHSNRVTMCHYPLRSWRASWHGTIHLHGHSHSTTAIRPEELWPGHEAHWRRRVDVGIDAWGLAPAHLDDVALALKEAQGG